MGGNLFSFRVEFSIQCPRCDRPLPLDGPVEKAHCFSCQSDTDIPRDYWIETLGNSCRKMQEMEPGGGTGSMLIGTFHGNLTLARFDPYCDSCKTEFDDPWDLVHGSLYRCGKCGLSYPVQEPPDWLTEGVPRIRTLVNALISSDGESAQDGFNAETLNAVSCPKCAGQLEVDGSSRLVKCDYCSAQVYLPDDFWLRIHGSRRKRRWFVISRFVETGEENDEREG